MKKLLIIQQDGTYFLEETLRVLETHASHLKSFELTILVDAKSLAGLSPLVRGITTDSNAVLSKKFDVSVNLSMAEHTWNLHGRVDSANKIGPYRTNNEFKVHDLWSTFFLTIKSQAPFLSFHLQDIYRNILGLKHNLIASSGNKIIKEIILGDFNPEFFGYGERDLLIAELEARFPNLPLRSVREVDYVSDLSNALYVGPAASEALRLSDAGASALIIGSKFQGFNLLPYKGNNFIISTGLRDLKTANVLPLISGMIASGEPPASSSYNIYQIDHENLFGAYLRNLNHSDNAYPFYQCHVVLWNFLLNLFDVNLDVSRCGPFQMSMMKEYNDLMTKICRLHDYAMVSIEVIHQEARAQASNADKIDGHLKNLREIDEIIAKVSDSHVMVRSFLDYYRIRRSQNQGSSLLEQIQHTFITYNEEHHALAALKELFSVTLRKNEVSI